MIKRVVLLLLLSCSLFATPLGVQYIKIGLKSPSRRPMKNGYTRTEYVIFNTRAVDLDGYEVLVNACSPFGCGTMQAYADADHTQFNMGRVIFDVPPDWIIGEPDITVVNEDNVQ